MDSRRFRSLQKLSPQYDMCAYLHFSRGGGSTVFPSFLKRSLIPRGGRSVGVVPLSCHPPYSSLWCQITITLRSP